MRRFPRTALTLALLSIASLARADVDLTGTWIVEYQLGGFGGTTTTTAVLAQTGTTLTFDDSMDDMTGTVDPTTGVFSVEGDPTPPPFGYPEGPPPERNGTAADGAHFTGTFTIFAPTPHFFWVNLDFPIIGTRAELVVCGNVVRDPGEQCDQGAENGVDGCCTASCQFVDPNGTIPCDAFVLSRAKLKQTGKLPDASRIAVKGVLTDPGADSIAGVTSFRVSYPAGDTILNTFTCVRKNKVLTCDGVNDLWRLKLATGRRGTVLTFKMKEAGLPRPLGGPVTVTFVDDLDVTRTAGATTCKATTSALSCTP